jgi:hypothetical protein
MGQFLMSTPRRVRHFAVSALLGLPIFLSVFRLLPGVPVLPVLAVDPPAPEKVALKFAWPARLRCEVEHATRASFLASEPPKGNTVHLSLEAVRGGGGWLVRQKVTGTTLDEPSPAQKPDTKAGKKPPETDPHELEVLLYPPFTVTNEGAFGGLELAPGDRAILEKKDAQQRQRNEMIKKLAPNVPLPPAEDALASATKKAASSWNVLVGAWAGKTIPEGEDPDLRTERDQAVPVGAPLHLVDRLSLTRGAPCKPAPRGGCVKLEVRSDPTDAPDTSGSAKVRFHSTTTLVTDPRTLIPRSYTRTMEMSAPLPASSGPAREETNHVVETMTFRCK